MKRSIEVFRTKDEMQAEIADLRAQLADGGPLFDTTELREPIKRAIQDECRLTSDGVGSFVKLPTNKLFVAVQSGPEMQLDGSYGIYPWDAQVKVVGLVLSVR